MTRADRVLLLLALIGAVVFFPSLPTLWPQRPDTSPRPADPARAAIARKLLRADGPLTEVPTTAFPVLFDRGGIEARLGLRQAAARLDAPRFRLSTPGAEVTLAPDGAVWSFALPRPKNPQPVVGADRAEALARQLLDDPDPAWKLVRLLRQSVRRFPSAPISAPVSPTPPRPPADPPEAPERQEWVAVFERPLPGAPGVLERASATIEGEATVRWERFALRDFRDRSDPLRAARRLDQAGQVVFGAFALVSLGIFFLRLRDGTARLKAPAICAGVVYLAALAAALLSSGVADPIDRAFSTTRDTLWTLVALVAALSAGDALDTSLGGARGASLRSVLRGRLLDPAVGAACLRGFGIACVCGGVLAVSVRVLLALTGGAVAPQPRGAFFTGLLDARLWPVAVGLTFVQVALLEELGYRYFAGAWLDAVTRRRWLAVLLPALVYGLTHTQVDFLPPAEPFWARPLAMTLVGIVWGIAFFRTDALTVIVSHALADMFLILWPKLSSGDPWQAALAGATVLVPLLPALGLLRRTNRGQVQFGDG